MNNDKAMVNIKKHIKKIIKKIINYNENNCYYDQFQKTRQQLEYLKQHIDAKDIKKATGYERKQQIELVNFVVDYLNSIADLGVKPFLIAGSLVGQYRHSGFVPWDDDIDFGLIRTDYECLVEYCKKNYPYYIYDKIDGNLQYWIDECTKANAEKYILFIYDNQVQISYGTNVLDRKCIDFFSFDYYSENESFIHYSQYLNKFKERLNNPQLSIKDRYEIIRGELANQKFCAEHSNKIYFGLDDMETFKRMFNEKWIEEKDLFPLVKRKFEGYEFWTPNNVKNFLMYEYPDFEKIPDDIGLKTHGYWDDYITNNYINVEFYLVDSFEIINLMPFYNLFRKAGAHAVFVAEAPTTNVAGTWFDYDRAIEILKENCLEYKEECNANAQIAFTTQDVINLSKYSEGTKRINCSYGYGLIRDSYAFSKRVVDGFDYKLCNGDYQKRILEKSCPKSTELFVVGMPKYYGKTFVDKNQIITELGINTNKKMVVYFPTWDENCCVEQFYQEFMQLREEFYIITKMHHVLERMKEYQNTRMLIKEFSDLVIESNYSLGSIASIADIIIADAKSGASLEAIYVNNTANAIFLCNVTNAEIDTFYLKEIQKVAPMAVPGQSLLDIINGCDWSSINVSKNKIVEDCYGNKQKNYVEECVNDLMTRVQKNGKK